MGGSERVCGCGGGDDGGLGVEKMRGVGCGEVGERIVRRMVVGLWVGGVGVEKGERGVGGVGLRGRARRRGRAQGRETARLVHSRMGSWGTGERGRRHCRRANERRRLSNDDAA